MEKINVAIFVSGRGSNCENLIRHFSARSAGRIAVALVLSNRADAPALEKARQWGVPVAVVSKEEWKDGERVLGLLRGYDIQFIVLAGFLLLIPDYLLEAFLRKIINIHPALLPKYGGKGMWGHHVHEAVKRNNEMETGMTVHYVTPHLDEGEIIAQYSVALSPEDTVDEIAHKEHLLEMEYFPKVVEEVIEEALPPTLP